MASSGEAVAAASGEVKPSRQGPLSLRGMQDDFLLFGETAFYGSLGKSPEPDRPAVVSPPGHPFQAKPEPRPPARRSPSVGIARETPCADLAELLDSAALLQQQPEDRVSGRKRVHAQLSASAPESFRDAEEASEAAEIGAEAPWLQLRELLPQALRADRWISALPDEPRVMREALSQTLPLRNPSPFRRAAVCELAELDSVNGGQLVAEPRLEDKGFCTLVDASPWLAEDQPSAGWLEYTCWRPVRSSRRAVAWLLPSATNAKDPPGVEGLFDHPEARKQAKRVEPLVAGVAGDGPTHAGAWAHAVDRLVRRNGLHNAHLVIARNPSAATDPAGAAFMRRQSPGQRAGIYVRQLVSALTAVHREGTFVWRLPASGFLRVLQDDPEAAAPGPGNGSADAGEAEERKEEQQAEDPEDLWPLLWALSAAFSEVRFCPTRDVPGDGFTFLATGLRDSFRLEPKDAAENLRRFEPLEEALLGKRRFRGFLADARFWGSALALLRGELPALVRSLQALVIRAALLLEAQAPQLLPADWVRARDLVGRWLLPHPAEDAAVLQSLLQRWSLT